MKLLIGIPIAMFLGWGEARIYRLARWALCRPQRPGEAARGRHGGPSVNGRGLRAGDLACMSNETLDRIMRDMRD